ncbi:chaperone protein dnaJ 11, chloroplastic-like [Lycium barbarum]|uniref:chaperone protein dnaJ 11, chloroplastic-like n=1 Tax=Lycium barbarum TaxID=112863 RepID=UPI00293EA1F7|nr:chaperone protein dnaJ 11, chloroplastic-like [Lycium barbarum]
MVQSLTLPALTSFSFSVPKPSYSATAVGFNCRVSRTRRATVCAVAVAEANPVLERRKSVSLYEVLRVNRDASAKEIKAAYRNLAKLYHPDAAAAAEEEESSRPDPTRDFIEIHDAYATLSDPSARALYDLKLTLDLRRRGIYPTRVKRSGFYPTRRWETDQCW